MLGSTLTAMLDGMEPQAAAQLQKILESDMLITNETGHAAVMHSISISMKRIADTLAESLELAYAIKNNR